MKFNPTIASSFALLGLSSLSLQSAVRLPAIFSDHMVLQRDVAVPVWGWADPGESVTVTIGGQEKTAVSDKLGKWMVKLGPLNAGEPMVLLVKASNTISIQDVVAGEVWLASGQSNMDYALGWRPYDVEAVANSTDPGLRCFMVPQKGALDPQSDLTSKWTVATPETVKGWSAVAFYFAKELRKQLGVPVAIIKSSYGGTPAEAWTSLEALGSNEAWKKSAEGEREDVRRLPEDLNAFPVKMNQWVEDNGANDPGNAGFDQGWASPNFDDSSWRKVEIPLPMARAGLKAGGLVWFRRTLDFPTGSDRDFDLNINWLNDSAATIYFNGIELQPSTPFEKFFKVQPRYRVASKLIHPGQSNTIAIRLHALTQNSIWGGQTKGLGLPWEESKKLDNHWKFNVEKEFAPLSASALASVPPSPVAKIQNTSAALFNAMINPLIPYGIRGAIWYQGESNTSPTERAFNYRKLLATLITDWRSRWNEGDFPFYIVQLANYGAIQSQPTESNWALLRESQSFVEKTVPATGLAVAIDIGEAEDIHPRNKKDVGERLALNALNRTYGLKAEDAGPSYESMQIEGNKIRLNFAHARGGLEAKGGPLKQFAIAGADGKFVWADATIDRESVIVSSPQVSNPMSVRYAWADNPEGCNLYNAHGLPASPFRTEAQDIPKTR